jgi:hypothetical protein
MKSGGCGEEKWNHGRKNEKAVSSWGLADTLTGIQTIFSTMTLRDIIRVTLLFENIQVVLEQRRYDADSG